MKKIYLVILLSILVFSGCTSQKDANKILTSRGFTEIQYTGYDLVGCPSHDWFHTGFKAKNINNKQIKGVVCSGSIVKPTTISY